MWAKVKRVGVFLVGLGGFILALVLMRGQAGKADEIAQKADEKRTQADLIDERIAALKEQGRMTDEEIAKERKRIEGLTSLEEIKDEFTRLGY